MRTFILAVLLSTSTAYAGWTALVLSSDSKQIYVSTSGSDANPGTIGAPKTLSGGIAALRDGFPDYLYLKKGETYPSIQWRKSGRSATEKMVITSYGSGPRPIIQAAANDQYAIGSVYGGANIRNLAIVDLDIRAGANSEGAYELLGAGANLLFEGNVFRRGGYIQGYNGARVSNVTFNRNSFLDSNGYSHAQGFFLSWVDGITFEENLVDNNGWISPGNTEVYGQGIYIHGSCGRNPAPMVRFNIFSNNGHNGIQVRPGGTVYGNVGYNNALHFGIGTIDPDDPDVSAGPRVTGSMQYNIAMESHNTVSQPKGFAFQLDHATNVDFLENIAARVGSGNYPLFLYGNDTRNISMLSSLSFLWTNEIACANCTGINTSGVDFRYALSASGNNFSAPNRTLGTYAQILNLGSTPQAFINAVRNQSKDHWDEALTAKAAISYIRAGFDKATPWDACLADLTNDAAVNVDDLQLFLQSFEMGNDTADVNHDGGVDVSDLILFMTHFEAGC